MVAPAVAAAGISAAGNVLGGLLGRKSSAKDQMILQYGLNKQAFMDQKAHEDFWNTQQLQFAQQQFARQAQRETHGIRERVVDAKAAGLHPLFALGANVGSSPSIGFSSPTGSAAGVGLAVGSNSRVRDTLGSVGRGIGAIIRAAEEHKAQEKANERAAKMDRARLRVLSADASRSEAEAMLAHSRVKREEQRSNQTRPPADYDRGVTPPAHTDAQQKALREQPGYRESHDYVRMPDGRVVRVIGKDYDEIAQADFLYELTKSYGRQLGIKVFDYLQSRKTRGNSSKKKPLIIRIKKSARDY